jgi:hypothetical protein
MLAASSATSPNETVLSYRFHGYLPVKPFLIIPQTSRTFFGSAGLNQ